MARRALTEEEERYIEETLLRRAGVVERREEKQKTRQETRKIRRRGFFRPRNIVFFIMMLPCLGTAALYLVILRAEAAVGGGSNLKWLAKQKMDSSTETLLKQYGVDWLPTLLGVYRERYIIIACMFTAGILLSMVVLLLDVFLTPRNKIES